MARRQTGVLPEEVTSVCRRRHENASVSEVKRGSEDKERSGTGASDLDEL